MRKTKYDLVFGLGNACSCTETIRKAGLQLLSFPYDWITDACTQPADAMHEILPRVREVCAGFTGWFAKDEFQFLQSIPSNRKDAYINRRMNMIFNHDFPTGTPYDQAFEAVQTRYRRRASRLLELIRTSSRVLVIRMDRPNQLAPTSVEDCLRARHSFECAFTPVKFDFFLFNYEKGRRFRDRIVEDVEPGFTRIAFDYRSYGDEKPEYQVDIRTTGRILSKRFSVRDYRTNEERRIYAKIRANKLRTRWKKGFLRLLDKFHLNQGQHEETH